MSSARGTLATLAASLWLATAAACATPSTLTSTHQGPAWTSPEHIGDCDTGWEPLRTQRGRLLAWLDKNARGTDGVTVFFEGALAYGDYEPRYEYALLMNGVAVHGLLEGAEWRERVTSPALLELLRRIEAGTLALEDHVEDGTSDRYDARLTIRARGEVRQVHVQTASWPKTSPAVQLLLELGHYEDALKGGPERLHPLDEPGTGKIICR